MTDGVVGQFDVEAAEPVPILSGRPHLAALTRRNNVKLTHYSAGNLPREPASLVAVSPRSILAPVGRGASDKAAIAASILCTADFGSFSSCFAARAGRSHLSRPALWVGGPWAPKTRHASPKTSCFSWALRR